MAVHEEVAAVPEEDLAKEGVKHSRSGLQTEERETEREKIKKKIEHFFNYLSYIIIIIVIEEQTVNFYYYFYQY